MELVKSINITPDEVKPGLVTAETFTLYRQYDGSFKAYRCGYPLNSQISKEGIPQGNGISLSLEEAKVITRLFFPTIYNVLIWEEDNNYPSVVTQENNNDAWWNSED